MKKNISVSGFTKNQRLQELEKIKSKYEKKSYVFLEYIDDGITNSIAIFEVDEQTLKNEKNTTKITIGIIVVSIIAFIFISSNDEVNTDSMSSKTLKEVSALPLDILKSYSDNYAKSKNVDVSNYDKFYSCIGHHIWKKEKTLSLGEISEWCYNDTKKEDYNKDTFNYVNIAAFMVDFNKFDGSYKPFVEYIKSGMTNPSSFEHIKTIYSFDSTTNPYMFIRCIFNGSNALGGVVEHMISAKVDEKTKNIYDVQVEK